MQVTLASQIVLVCRSEIEKTPKIVFPHEVAVLRELHGDSRIELSDAESPVGTKDVDLDVEFQRLLNEYQQPAGKPHPVVETFGDFDGFVQAVQGDKPAKRRAKSAD